MTELQKFRLEQLSEISAEARKLNIELKSFPKTAPELKDYIKQNESALRRDINLNDEKELDRQMILRRGLFKNKFKSLEDRFAAQKKNLENDLLDYENRDVISKVYDLENENLTSEIHNLTIGEVTKIQTLIQETKYLITD